MASLWDHTFEILGWLSPLVPSLPGPLRPTRRHDASSSTVMETLRAPQGFVSVTSHELRTPATVVLGLLETIWARWDVMTDADRRRMVEVALHQSHRLARHVENTLALSQAVAGELRPSRSDIDLHHLLCEVIDDGGSTEPVEIVGSDLPVATDPAILRNILTRLVDNARLYGVPPIRLEVCRGTEQLAIACVDHGPGIDPAFVRGENTHQVVPSTAC